jgi:hypothetical protein
MEPNIFRPLINLNFTFDEALYVMNRTGSAGSSDTNMTVVMYSPTTKRK